MNKPSFSVDDSSPAPSLTETGNNSYDDIPYESHPFSASHPRQLETLATLFGLTPTPIDRCRVLEMGCASGGNLIPMGCEFLGSQFVGIDLSAHQIAQAQETVVALGLKNVEMHQLNLMDAGPELGQFDYIIAHGIYSWVPPGVQDKILSLCSQNLAPHGLALVSYNTLPGWHMKGMIRDMMGYHVQQFPKSKVRIRQARALLTFLAQSVPRTEKNPYGLYLRNELEFLQKMRDDYIFHEHLEENNLPLYFYQFMERAAAYQLQYVGETPLGGMALNPQGFPAQAIGTLHKIAPSLLHREQYLDFLRNRTFRQTILCHQSLKPDHSLSPAHVETLFVSSATQPVASSFKTYGTQEFRTPNGTVVPIKKPITQAALRHLAEIFPRSVSFTELAHIALTQSQIDIPASAEITAQRKANLASSLIVLYGMDAVTLHAHPPAVSPQDEIIAEEDGLSIASPYVRLQAQRGLATVTNLHHSDVNVDAFACQVLARLDGTQTQAQILEHLLALTKKGELKIEIQGNNLRKTLTDSLHRVLVAAQRNHLLIG